MFNNKTNVLNTFIIFVLSGIIAGTLNNASLTM